jgi:hypothetical protein
MIGRICLDIEDYRLRGEGRKIIGSIIEKNIHRRRCCRRSWLKKKKLESGSLVAHVHMCNNKLL